MRNLVPNIVALTVAIIIFTAILAPAIGDAEDQTVDGQAHTEVNTAPSKYLGPYTGSEPITITVSQSEGTVATSVSGLTLVATPDKLVSIENDAVYVTDSEGASVPLADGTVTIQAGGAVLIGTASTSPSTATHGLYESFAQPVYVEGSTMLIALSSASPYIAQERCDGTAIPIAHQQSEDMRGVYEVASVGTDGKLIAPIDYVWHEQVPAMDDTVKMVLDVVPLLIAVGLLLTCVYMFMSSRRGY